MSEDRWLAEALAGLPADARVLLGPGDDAAVLASGDGAIVVANDVLVDGVHFLMESCGPAAAARKALAVNLSDLAAMGALPVGFLVGAVLPDPANRSLFRDLMRGFRDAAGEFDCPLLGGDTNVADTPLVLSVTVLGRAGSRGVVRRHGARSGDILSVTGPLGGSLAGRHLHFTPRLTEGRVLADAGIAHAMLDLSDGLSRDLPRLCAASGLGAWIEAESIPIHPAAEGDVDRALHDGEDFELLVAHSPLEARTQQVLREQGVELTAVGRMQEEPVVVLRREGHEGPLKPEGFDHVGG